MGLIDDLIGGNSFDKNKSHNGTYNIYIQFDEDKPLILYENIEDKKVVTLIFDKTDGGNLNIQCPKTGKKVRIFSKNNDE